MATPKALKKIGGYAKSLASPLLTAGGALAGFVVGGPVGALIGAGLGGTIAGGYEAYRSNKAMAKEVKRAQGTQAHLQGEMQARMDAQGQEEVLAQEQARRRQRQLAVGRYGRRDTILTGPLGLTDEATVARKTLLGQ